MGSYSHAPSKIQKSINKRKGPNSSHALHASSRDARRLQRASQRDEKLARQTTLRARANEKYLSRLEWFRDAARELMDASTNTNSPSMPTDSPFTPKTLGSLLQSYLTRHDTSTQTQPQRKGRSIQLSAQERADRAAVQDDVEEARSGFWMPDLCHEESLRFLLDGWDEGWSSLSNIKFVRVRIVTPVSANEAVDGSRDESGRGKHDSDGAEASDVRITESKFPPKAGS